MQLAVQGRPHRRGAGLEYPPGARKTAMDLFNMLSPKSDAHDAAPRSAVDAQTRGLCRPAPSTGHSRNTCPQALPRAALPPSCTLTRTRDVSVRAIPCGRMYSHAFSPSDAINFFSLPWGASGDSQNMPDMLADAGDDAQSARQSHSSRGSSQLKLAPAARQEGQTPLPVLRACGRARGCRQHQCAWSTRVRETSCFFLCRSHLHRAGGTQAGWVTAKPLPLRQLRGKTRGRPSQNILAWGGRVICWSECLCIS